MLCPCSMVIGEGFPCNPHLGMVPGGDLFAVTVGDALGLNGSQLSSCGAVACHLEDLDHWNPCGGTYDRLQKIPHKRH
jgi:hypothetical protein